MEPCPKCGKADFATAQGRAGHIQFCNAQSSAQRSAAEPPAEQPSDAEPSTLDQARVEEVVGALAERVDGLDQQVRELHEHPAQPAGLGVHAGVCSDPNCGPCRSARAEIERATRRAFAEDLEQAAAYSGHHALSEQLGEAYDVWVSAGRPEVEIPEDGDDAPAQEPQPKGRPVVGVRRG